MLFTRAANCLDPVERLCHIAAFAVAGYSGSKMRTTRKPFNPMLVGLLLVFWCVGKLNDRLPFL
jgi:hypothetical protein